VAALRAPRRRDLAPGQPLVPVSGLGRGHEAFTPMPMPGSMNSLVYTSWGFRSGL
jgi:hypothetical protein